MLFYSLYLKVRVRLFCLFIQKTNLYLLERLSFQAFNIKGGTRGLIRLSICDRIPIPGETKLPHRPISQVLLSLLSPPQNSIFKLSSSISALPDPRHVLDRSCDYKCISYWFEFFVDGLNLIEKFWLKLFVDTPLCGSCLGVGIWL